MNKIFYIGVFFLITFTGCSTKQYFAPEDTLSFKQDTLDLNGTIIDLNSDGATLDDKSVIYKELKNNKISKNFKFLNFSDNTLLSADSNQSINLKNTTLDETLHFDKNIISASKNKNIIAFGSIDNSITLYDIVSKKTLFKEYLRPSAINNIKIANPIFLSTVVLYPTLDGKIVIIDLKKNSIIKTINIDPKSDINNIIFLKEYNNTLIAATTKKVFTFDNGNVKLKDIDVQNILMNKNFIYVATLDGQIIKYDLSLNKIASKKFKFAKFNALAFGTSLYALESQEFLIQISDDFKKVKIFDFSFDNEEKVIGIDNKIYFEDEYIILK